MEIRLPASKSVSARALIINALSAAPCELRNLSDCDDTVALQSVLQGGGDVGAAGTAMRFATALLAATPGAERTLTGTERMLERPIGILVDALRRLGADIEYTGSEGYPPLHIRGKQLTTERLPLNEEGIPFLTLPANISSQYISALMMIAPTIYSAPSMGGIGAESIGLVLQLEGSIASRPYIEMTRALMAEWSVPTEWKDNNTLYINAHAYERETPYAIEADWSAASYFYAAALIYGSLTCPDLRLPSVQGDHVVAEIFSREFGFSCTRVPEFLDPGAGIPGPGSPKTETLVLDFSDIPDLVQTLVVACCLVRRAFYFTGLESLRIKETDRIAALIAECAKFGWHLTQPASGTLAWDGSETILPSTAAPTVRCYGDHRMAMAFAPCLLRWRNTTFDDPDVVSKSFPTFWHEFHKLL